MPTVASLFFGAYGRFISKPVVAAVISITVIAVNIGLIVGSEMWNVPLATDISRLWIDPAGQVYKNNLVVSTYGSKVIAANNEVVFLGRTDGENMATEVGMDLWRNMTIAAMDTVVWYNGTAFTVFDICNGRNGQSAYTFGCSMSNPIDYFQEGAIFFPSDGAAQWLLDTRVAYNSGNAGLWGWAITADLASLGSVSVYNKWFIYRCLTSKRLLCGNTTRLLEQVNTLIATPLPSTLDNTARATQKVGKVQLAWVKAQLALVGILQSLGNCDSANFTNTNTGAVDFSSDPYFFGALLSFGYSPSVIPSLDNCKFAGASSCPGQDLSKWCSLTDLQNVALLNFTSPCATCITAAMRWTGDLNSLTTSAFPVPVGIIANALMDPTTVGNTITLVVGALKASTPFTVAVCNEAFSSSAQNLVVPPSACVSLWDSYFTASVLGASGDTTGALATVPVRAGTLATLGLDAKTELYAVNGGKSVVDSIWRDLLNSGKISTVNSVLRRHYARPSYKSGSISIPVILSGFNNDLLTQNLRPGIFGGATPSARNIVAGKCQCISGIVGLNCILPTDPICDCDTSLKSTCISGLLNSCSSIAACAGYSTILALVANAAALGNPPQLAAYANFAKETDVLAGLNHPNANLAKTAIGIVTTKCKAVVPCLDDFAFSNFGSIAPSSYAGILADGSWNFALLSDLSGSGGNFTYSTRANLLLAGFAILLQDASSSTPLLTAQLGDAVTEIQTFAGTISSGNALLDTTDDFSNIGACFGPTQSINGCLLTELVNFQEVSQYTSGMGVKCPSTLNAIATSSVLGSVPLTVFGFFHCLAESNQAFPGFVSSRTSSSLWPKVSSPIKAGACLQAAAPTGTQLSLTSCKQALGATLFISVTSTYATIAQNPALGPAAAAGFLASGVSSGSTTPASVAQTTLQAQYLANKVAASADFMTTFDQLVWSNCATYSSTTCPLFTAVVDGVLASGCTSAKNAFSATSLYLDSCVVLVENLIGALQRQPVPTAKISRSLAQYKFMGTVFGSCSASGGVVNGGGDCWQDSDCGLGTCNMTGNSPFEFIRTFSSILFSSDGEGVLNQMVQQEKAYRELANKPIFDRYTAKHGSGRRLVDFGVTGPVPWLTAEAGQEIVEAWRKEMLKSIEAFRDEYTLAKAEVVTSDASSDLLDEVSEADPKTLVLGYGLMLLYGFLSCTNWSTDVPGMLNASRGLAAISGIILVALSVASGLGVSHLAGIEWSAAATQIVPFVMLGLGVSDTFVLLRVFPYYQDGLTPEEACAKALIIAGPPMLLVSATNAGVFAVGILTGMPVVVNFALQSVIVVVANYITTNLMFPALLVLDYKRMGAGRMDMAPCIHVGTSARAQVHNETSQYEMNIFNRCLTPIYAKCILSIPGKIFVLAWSVSFLGSAVYGVDKVSELGLQLADIAPANSELSNALITRDRDFGFYSMSIVTPETDWSLRESQQGLVTIFNNVMASPYVVDGSGTPWIQAFMAWGQVKTPMYDPFVSGGYCNANNARTAGYCGLKFNCSVITADDSVVGGLIPFFNRSDFYRCLETWINIDLTYEALKPGFVLEDPYASRGNRRLFYSRVDSTGQYLPFTTGTLITLGLNYNSDFVNLINDVRAVANSETVPPSFPTGEPIDFWDQYTALREIINNAIGYGLLICFCTIWILLVCLVEGDSGIPKRIFATFWASALTTGVIALTVYELYGYMAFAGLKISAIPAISIIMSTGVAVEYTAYITVVFVNAAGTGNERATHALMTMLAPVIDGAVTMFLGVVMLATSPFLFIVKYFFYPWLLIIFFGMFNGVAFLPVLLAIVGPPAVSSAAKKTEDSKDLAFNKM